MATVEFWSDGVHAGYRVTWYKDDDNNSGYGKNPRIAYAYESTLTQARELAKQEKPPANSKWRKVDE